MAQLDGMQHHGDSSGTVKQLSNTDSPSACNVPRTLEGRKQNEDKFHHSRKISLIAKLKAKAKKWRLSLKKKRGHGNLPPWCNDDEMEVDPELHGGSSAGERVFGQSFNRSGKNNKTKSTHGATFQKSLSDIHVANASIPKNTINDNSRAKSFDQSRHERTSSPLNSRIEHIVAERNAIFLREKLLHIQASRDQSEPEKVEHRSDFTPTRDSIDRSSILEQKSMLPIIGSTTRIQTHIELSPLNEQKEKFPIVVKNTNETRADKSTVNDPKEKVPSLSISTESEQEEKRPTTPQKSDQENEKLTETEGMRSDIHGEEQTSPTSMKTVTEGLGPAYASVSEATQKITSQVQGMSMPSSQSTAEEQNHLKVISVKEYLRNKLDPGEDERALSQVISEVISPRRNPSEKGVVAKVREAVSLMLQSEESPSSSSLKKSESSTSIPVSSNAHEVEEDSQGRVLQAN